jgi:hypothetical protein
MTKTVKTQSEYYQIYKDEVQSEASEFTDFSDGSLHDIIAGALSTAMNENSELIISEFSKTFFGLAQGPEFTGGVDNLEKLAVDHFGDRFQRPDAEKATGEVTFTRPNTDAGNVTIGAGTVTKTEKDANGEDVRFETVSEVTLTGLSISADVIAIVEGASGNVDAGQIAVIESALTDPTISVSNASAMAGGADEQSDAEYRETIRALIESLAGATEAAIKGAALALSGVSFASTLTIIKAVKEWDIGGSVAVGDFFRIPYVELYVADENGNSSQPLIDEVTAAILPVRAAGVLIVVKGGTASDLSWNASITLNPAGPNYAALSADPQMILDSMQNYINEEIDINEGFDKILANQHILGIWGSAGTNDLTSFITNTPSGNVAGSTGVKLVADVMSIS